MTDFVSQAKKLLLTWEFCNVGLLQRKLCTGYVTAAKVVEELRNQGVIGSEWNEEGRGYPVLIGRQSTPRAADLPTGFPKNWCHKCKTVHVGECADTTASR